MNQTRWNPPISQFIWINILLLKMVANWNPFILFYKKHRFHILHFPNSTDISQNQPATITLNTGSPRTLLPRHCHGFTQWVTVLLRSWNLYMDCESRAKLWSPQMELRGRSTFYGRPFCSLGPRNFLGQGSAYIEGYLQGVRGISEFAM